MKTAVDGFDNRYFLSINETCEFINLSRSTIYRMEKRGHFPKRVQLSPQRKGYRLSDLKKFLGGLK
tara:strand:+ start:322 stop:519 length:198 start_codon:yes stop_codon:yes gene_type:complete